MCARWWGFAALLATACSDPAVTQGNGVGAGSSGGDDGSTTANDATTAGMSGTVTTEADASTGPAGPIPAAGISVDWVEANQAVGVRIGQDGGGVGGEDRTSPLIANRITLVRAFWDIPEDWQPREIEAHFTVNFPDGTSDTKIDRKMVEGPSFIGNLQEAFFWGLMPEEAQPGLTYHIELFETDASFADPSVTAPPRLPEDGSEAFVGIEDSYQLLKVVLVPFNYDDGADCVTQPDTSEETMQLFEDYLYMMNPVDRVEMTIHESVDWPDPLTSFVPLNQYMAQIRFDEEAPAETYYYGLVDVCDGGLGGAGGLANGIPQDPTSPDVAYQRVSSGLSLDPEWSAETFVHEVGHSQGRRHVACNGEEGGPDPSYPIEGGDLGEWGFGVVDFQLRHPTVYKDYMTYCNPAWVSTWGLNKVFPVIRALSMWDENYPGADGVRPEPTGSLVLVGNVLPGGEEAWYTVPGALTGRATGTVEFETEAGTLAQPAEISDLPDAQGTMIVAEVPAPLSTVRSLVRVEGPTRTAIDLNTIRVRQPAR